MPQSPEEMAAAMLANMKEKSGKTIEAWLKIVAKTKLAKHREILNHLKSEHGVTYGYASLIATKALDSGEPPATGGDLVDAQYSGAKSELRPIYEALIEAVQRFGKDVDISPKKSYVSLRRNKQFGIIQASTKTRIDVGINCKGAKPTKRLEVSGSFNGMVSHRVRVNNKDDIDKELIDWLKQAYADS
ncbi:MAG: DUF4287 domain-containing protein [Planctomycetes bacterium]|nr:DUF4287 domain-containing protein [Planctomycetota bacterium]